MHKVEFELKVVTPLFMFGAYPDQPELRESEFKGMMRFWWRALKADDDISELKKEEKLIFGGISQESSGQEESVGKKIFVRVKREKIYEFVGNNLKRDYNLDMYYSQEEKILKGKHKGILYLLYSTAQKKYFKPNMRFKILMYSKEEKILSNAIAAFWCALNLGNFGSRCRKGLGSLVVTTVKGSTFDLDFIPKGKNSEELVNWILKNVKIAASLINSGTRKCESYSNIISSPFIISKENYTCWQDALNAIGEKYMSFREKKGIMERALFGLPVVLVSKEKVIGIGRGDTGDIVKNENKIERRSSPLLFKIIESGGKLYWLVLKFNGKLLPENAKLALVTKRKDSGEQGKKGELVVKETLNPSFGVVDEFLEELGQSNEKGIFSI